MAFALFVNLMQIIQQKLKMLLKQTRTIFHTTITQ